MICPFFNLGLAERGATVKIEGKSLGYLKKDLLAYAYEGKQRKFDPFKEELQKYEESMRLKLTEEEVLDTGNGLAVVEEKPKRKKIKNED